MAVIETVVKDNQSPVGNLVEQIYTVTFGSGVTSGELKTGLSSVKYASFISKTDDGHDTFLNFSDAGTTVVGGSVFFDNVANSATGQVLVKGA